MSKETKIEIIKDFVEKLKERTIEVDVSFGYGEPCFVNAVTMIEVENLLQEITEDENG